MGARGTVSPTAGSCPYPSYRPGGRKGWEGAVQAGAVKCRGRVGSLPPSRDEEPRSQEAKCWWSAGGARIPPPGWGSSDPTSRRAIGSSRPGHQLHTVLRMSQALRHGQPPPAVALLSGQVQHWTRPGPACEEHVSLVGLGGWYMVEHF